jgi:hypothetical protein
MLQINHSYVSFLKPISTLESKCCCCTASHSRRKLVGLISNNLSIGNVNITHLPEILVVDNVTVPMQFLKFLERKYQGKGGTNDSMEVDLLSVTNSSRSTGNVSMTNYASFGENNATINVNDHQRAFQFIDGDGIRRCFSNKNILLLGDSTMGETVDDLVILLTKIGSNATLFEDYLKPSNTSSNNHVRILQIPNDIQLSVEHFIGRRNVSIHSSILNMTIRYRFTGHHIVSKNFGGLATFFHPEFQGELDCLLGRNRHRSRDIIHGSQQGTGLWCSKKDIILFNSGIHDADQRGKQGGNTALYEEQLDRLFREWKSELNDTRIVWKSNFMSPYLLKGFPSLPVMDSIAVRLTRKYGIPYVNTTLVYEFIEQQPEQPVFWRTSPDSFLHLGTVSDDKTFHDHTAKVS